MQLALWMASGLLAFAMLGAGTVKLVTPRMKLMEKMKWATTWSDGNVKKPLGTPRQLWMGTAWTMLAGMGAWLSFHHIGRATDGERR